MARNSGYLSANVIATAAFLFGLVGCNGADIPEAKSTVGRNPLVAETPSPDETVRGEDDPPVVTLDLGSALHEHRLSEGDALPGNIIVPTTNLNAVPVTAALQAVLAGTDVSLSWDTGALGDRLVTVMNLSGPLPKVVEQVCSAAKVFCNYHHGTLSLLDKDTFVVGLPPIPKSVTGGGGSAGGAASANSMIDTLGQLIGSKIQVDEQGGNIIYTTDVEGEDRVNRYLEQLRNGRPLIIMQLYVWEVTLSKENGEGINWSYLKLSDIGPGYSRLALNAASSYTSLNSVSGSMSLGAVTSGRLNTSSLTSFLATQGRVQTVSNPQITFVSGSGASLKVGGKQRYISQVGTITASNTSGTSGSNSTNTVSTDSIDTGLTIEVNGSYENGVVFSNLDLSLTNLVSLNPTASGGGTIDLPETTDEKINTVIRVRPGDNLVMAGLVTSKDNNNRQGLPLGSAILPTYGDDQANNHELVVVVKPSVILFSDKKNIADAKQKEMGRVLPPAVLIDHNGTESIVRPDTTPISSAAPAAAPTAALASSSSPVPTLAAPAATDALAGTAPAAPIPLIPANDGAVVDQRMMQRGFSHAFDDLLQPASASLTENSGAKR